MDWLYDTKTTRDENEPHPSKYRSMRKLHTLSNVTNKDRYVKNAYTTMSRRTRNRSLTLAHVNARIDLYYANFNLQ